MTISALSIYVSDLSAATTFYTEVLGFRVEKALGDFATKLENAGTSLLLCAGGSVPREASYPTGVVLGHTTKDLTARLKELQGKGVRFVHKEPEEFPAGRYMAFTDAFGISHELLEYR